MKICFITTGFKKTGGGMSRMVTSLSNYFSSKGYQVHLLFLFKTEFLFDLNENIYFYEPNLERDRHQRYIYAIKLIPYVRGTLKKINPDVIIGFGEWFNPYTMISTIGLRYSIYLADRMSPIAKLSFPLNLFKKLLYRYANGVIAQTNTAAAEIQKQTKAKNVIVIPNPVNCIEKVFCEPKNRIISVGRLSKEKGHKFLIEAFAKIQNKGWELSLVGDGNERENLEELSKKLNVLDKVIFHGALRNFSYQLSEAQIFVLPSLSEGFPNALIEAMSLPIACISSNCIAGPADIIEHNKNGLLVEPGNVEQLADALNLLISNRALRDRLAKEAYNVRVRLDFEVIGKKYLDFILPNSLDTSKFSAK